MKELVFIVNQHAGNRNPYKVELDARRKLWGWRCQFHITSTIQQMQNICSSLDPNLHEAVIICGGDGTINHCLPELCKRKVPLAIMPFGTANDFANQQGMTPNWNTLQTCLDRRLITEVDLLSANGKLFATVGGLGLGSELTDIVNQRRKNSKIYQGISAFLKSNFYSYVAIEKILLSPESFIAEIAISSEQLRINISASSVLVCNQPRLGGDLLVSDRSKNNDGKFEVVILSTNNQIDLLRSMVSVKTANVFPANYRVRTKDISIRSLNQAPLKVFGDGEILDQSSEIHFSILPKALLVYSNESAASIREKRSAA